jgi:hypothetical protein
MNERQTHWLPPLAGRTYIRGAYVCQGVFAEGYWLAHPFEDHRLSPPCGYVEPPGTPMYGRGYHCPRCGGALLRRYVKASYVDMVEVWIEAHTQPMRTSLF